MKLKFLCEKCIGLGDCGEWSDVHAHGVVRTDERAVVRVGVQPSGARDGGNRRIFASRREVASRNVCCIALLTCYIRIKYETEIRSPRLQV